MICDTNYTIAQLLEGYYTLIDEVISLTATSMLGIADISHAIFSEIYFLFWFEKSVFVHRIDAQVSQRAHRR